MVVVGADVAGGGATVEGAGGVLDVVAEAGGAFIIFGGITGMVVFAAVAVLLVVA
jgi:hypothetical protein